MLGALAAVVLGARAAGPRSPSTITDPGAPAGMMATTHVRAEGRVVAYPGAAVAVGSEAGGRVERIHVQEHDRVRGGQVIAELSSAEERAAIAEARAGLAEAEAEVALLEVRHQRADSLARRGHVSPDELDGVTHGLAAARARRAAAAAQIERLEAMLSKRQIRAPISGVVIERFIHPGEIVAPGARVATIVDLARTRVEGEVDEYDVSRVREGARVVITAEGLDGLEWIGSVESVPDAVVPRRLRPEDPVRPTDTRVLLVKVSLPPDTPFKLGQRVELRIGGE
jgi:RND family efflux transporter MFP subunit